jgi:SAM-dependent methyltransferase
MSVFLKQWFESWFDSPYYHILYKERDELEAQRFLDNVIDLLNPAPYSRILDAGCGHGRHAVYLNKKGFDVYAFDLAPKSIEFDKRFENDHLQFYVHDMREIFRVNYFDYVFNLFSSFGFFDSYRDNANAIRAVTLNLKPGGTFLIDYMNSYRVRNTLIPEQTKKKEGIKFQIRKKIVNKKIIKEIMFNINQNDHEYEEHLQLFEKEDFEKMFEQEGLTVKHTFGDYSLNPFNKETSERLILIAEKK